MTQIIIREASVEDADEIARVHTLAWQETYAYAFGVEALAEINQQRRAEGWAKILAGEYEGDGTEKVVVVAEAPSQKVFGFASMGRDQDNPTLELRQLYAIYLLQSHQQRGLGRQLLQTIIADQPASLWVLRGNDRAINFYRRQGFEFDGTERTEEFFKLPAHELRMVR